MRVAVSGTHFSGKSTLIAALSKQLPNYTTIDEPYFLLEQMGHPFSCPPNLDDFEAQLKLSIAFLQESGSQTLFDRCPLDFLAYALSLETAFDLDKWTQNIEKAMPLLDLIIFLPLENPDHIPLPPSEDREWRSSVERQLHELLLEDSCSLLDHVNVLEVSGPLDKRVKMIKPSLGY